MITPSIRQRRQLKRWAKGKLIKVREIKEFMELGWIGYGDRRMPGAFETFYYLTIAGREVIGKNTQVRCREEVQSS